MDWWCEFDLIDLVRFYIIFLCWIGWGFLFFEIMLSVNFDMVESNLYRVVVV